MKCRKMPKNALRSRNCRDETADHAADSFNTNETGDHSHKCATIAAEGKIPCWPWLLEPIEEHQYLTWQQQ